MAEFTELKIRQVPLSTVARLNELASRAVVSREEYIRRLFAMHVETIELTKTVNKYEELINQLMLQLEKSNRIIQENTNAFSDLMEVIKEDL